jgi:hypothetical protein
MKRVILPFVATVLVSTFSCQKAENVSLSSQVDKPSPVTKAGDPSFSSDRFAVSLSDAKRYSELYKPGKPYSVTPYVEDRDTLLYLINYNEGWLVLSGDRRMNPVFAQDAQGFITMKDESACSFWLKQYAKDVLRIKMDEDHQDNEYTSIWKAISPEKDGHKTRSEPKWVIREGMYNETSVFDAVVPVMLQTKWGQQAPWNNGYPLDTYFNKRCYVGCVAIAFSQVLYYWHNYAGVPTKLSHTISCNSTVYSGLTYDGALNLVYNIGFSRSDETNNSTRWSDMALSASSGGNTSYVGDFMLDIGNRVAMGYSGGGSGAYINYAAYVLSPYYGFSYVYGPYSESAVKNQLQNNRPVIVGGPSTNNSSRHAWVIDGRTIEYQYYSMFRYCEYSTDWGPNNEVYDTFEEAQAIYGFSAPYDLRPFSRTFVIDRFHMNWGEDGVGDGLYRCGEDHWNYYNYGCAYSTADLNTCFLFFN